MGKTQDREQKRRGDNFPLFLRSDGRWCKKIGGKHRYFGRDKAEAEKRYYRQIGKLMDGQEPDPDDPTLRYVFNLYLGAQQAKVETGEIGPRTMADSVSTLKQAVATLGDRLISSLQPEDFATLKAAWSKGRSIVTVAGDIRRLRAAFNWALRDRKLAALPQYGADFRQAPARSFELARSQRAALLFEPAELRKLLHAADPQLRAMICLGANLAFLPVDIARLEFEEISHDFKWIRQARRKTGIDRRAALWPETAEAIRAAIKLRPKPAMPEYANLVFLTETGRPMVRATNVRKPEESAAHNVNRISKDFRALQQTCKVHRIGRGFNALRHGFLTIAEAGGDFVAVAKVMGHKVPGVSSHYREHISDDRIKAVCSIVRDWLFPKKRKPR